MHTRSVIAALLLAIVHLAMAGPPACLIAALGQQSNPADIKGLCGNGYSAMEGNITHVCSGSALTDAYNAYSSTCLVAGVTVSALPTSSTSGSATATGTGSQVTGTGATTGSGTASAASPTSSDKKDAAAGLSPQPLLLALTGLFATGMTFLFVL